MSCKKYLLELARLYPTPEAVASEIINLRSILSLPKGTEHFMSDLHGEHEAFSHIRRSASGVIRKKIDALFVDSMTEGERATLATLIYYPEEKLDELREGGEISRDWYEKTLKRLVAVCRTLGEKYSRKRVGRHLTLSCPSFLIPYIPADDSIPQ